VINFDHPIRKVDARSELVAIETEVKIRNDTHFNECTYITSWTTRPENPMSNTTTKKNLTKTFQNPLRGGHDFEPPWLMSRIKRSRVW